MLHHHASVLLDAGDVTNDSCQSSDIDDDDDDDDDDDADKVRLLIVGGGGNCFSFGTHFNRQLMALTIRSDGSSAASNYADAVS